MKKNNWFENFLDKLIKVNKEEYGNKTLDCCELNKSLKDIKDLNSVKYKPKSK